MILIWTLEKNIGIKDNCWLARSRGAFLGVSYFIPGKKNIGIIHNCWLARSRGAFLEVSHFIPGKKILVLNMIDGSLAQGVPFGRFDTLYLVKENIGIIHNCWLARSRGAFLGVSYFIPGKKNIGIIHNCWLARSRGAFWEVSYFIPG